MPNLVLDGAQLKCSEGSATSVLVVTPRHPMKESKKQLATVQDNVPSTNVPPFGLCKSLTNPKVAAATAAALAGASCSPSRVIACV